jgi:hypothetical protein
MINFEFKWLTSEHIGIYAELCANVEEKMRAVNSETFMDFLTMPQCHYAFKEGRVGSLWHAENLVASIIVEHCNIKDRLLRRFSGEAIDALNHDGIYMRNGLVSPHYQGRGVYSILMRYMSELYPDVWISGTMNMANIAPQYACAAAGMVPSGEITRSDGAKTLIMARAPMVNENIAVA